ncbi:hypothetical protein Q5762_13845 [Streptomyces sp. P9(2023)]|uniref:hypothetical protein n=1 Tax=Streptomyces sp. P9(2023) TaxID=3064394 RepID=UPI0028F44737|nr:hypothetical protein [Streptomyces sp. P9(2023)]MDT9689399.1 hypothetical protein [Streptomyces sp. P9(2023)]
MATKNPAIRLPFPCPACGEAITVGIRVLESTVRDGEETHVWDMDATAAREHAEQHHQAT